jgi:predicted RNA-binding Zn-ribbon protein involved in translation (DUF1610 family)
MNIWPKLLSAIAVFVVIVLIAIGMLSDLDSSDIESARNTAVLGGLGMFFILAVVVGVVTFAHMVDCRRRAGFLHRKSMGLCVHCGYDLTGTEGKCPECGKWTVRRAISSEMENP